MYVPFVYIGACEKNSRRSTYRYIRICVTTCILRVLKLVSAYIDMYGEGCFFARTGSASTNDHCPVKLKPSRRYNGDLWISNPPY